MTSRQVTMRFITGLAVGMAIVGALVCMATGTGVRGPGWPARPVVTGTTHH